MPYSRAFVNWLRVWLGISIVLQIFIRYILPSVINQYNASQVSLLLTGIAIVRTIFLVTVSFWGIALEGNPRDRLGWGLILISLVIDWIFSLFVAPMVIIQGIQAFYMYSLIFYQIRLMVSLSAIYLIGRPDTSRYLAVSLALIMMSTLSSPLFSSSETLYWLNNGEFILSSGFLGVLMVKADGLLKHAEFDTYPTWQVQ